LYLPDALLPLLCPQDTAISSLPLSYGGKRRNIYSMFIILGGLSLIAGVIESIMLLLLFSGYPFSTRFLLICVLLKILDIVLDTVIPMGQKDSGKQIRHGTQPY
jgi:hypothetical protein